MKFRSPGLSKHSSVAANCANSRSSAGNLFCEGTAVRLNLRFLLKHWPTVKHPHGRTSAEGMGRKLLIARIIIEAHKSWRRGQFGEVGRVLHRRGKVSVCVLAAAM